MSEGKRAPQALKIGAGRTYRVCRFHFCSVRMQMQEMRRWRRRVVWVKTGRLERWKEERKKQEGMLIHVFASSFQSHCRCTPSLSEKPTTKWKRKGTHQRLTRVSFIYRYFKQKQNYFTSFVILSFHLYPLYAS